MLSEKSHDNKYKATAVLCICAILAVVTSIWDSHGGNFFSGLLSRGFIAATIGGLADWFAVTAIFKKPLGIGWRTDILRRNRPRIMGALRDFIAGDLLSRQNIMRTLDKEDFSAMLITYLDERGGREKAWAIVDVLLSKTVHGVDADKLMGRFEKPLRDALHKIDLAPIVKKGLDGVNCDDSRKIIIQALSPLVRPMIMDDDVQSIIMAHIKNARESYEGENSMRQAMFDYLDLSDEKLLEIADEHINEWLINLENGEGEIYGKIDGAIHEQIASMEENTAIYGALEKWKNERIDNLDMRALARERIQDIIAHDYASWRNEARRIFDAYIDDFKNSDERRLKFDRWIKSFLDRLVDEHHDIIPRTIDEYLNKMSDDEIIEFAQSKVDNDLQIIRINGSIVGALVGMALYVLIFAIEGVPL